MSVNNNLQTGSGRIRVARFTASGSWTAPAGVFCIQALAVGGGGGGGAARSASSTYLVHAGAGGGGGVFDELLEVVPGTTYAVTIGTGGAGANTTSSAGANGTNTTLGSIMTAPGGQGGVTAHAATDTRVLPTSNPGGSMGGWAGLGPGDSYTPAGPGHGAASPIIATYTTSTGHTVFALQIQNGYGVVTVPALSHSGSSGSVATSIYYPATSATTAYPRIRRNEAVLSSITYMTQFLPGLPWKGLGSGGAAALYGKGTDYANFENAAFIDASAGRLSLPQAALISNTTSAIFNGTNGVANTGAGGGGSTAAHTNTSIAAGGNGGSGYLEVTWQE